MNRTAHPFGKSTTPKLFFWLRWVKIAAICIGVALVALSANFAYSQGLDIDGLFDEADATVATVLDRIVPVGLGILAVMAVWQIVSFFRGRPNWPVIIGIVVGGFLLANFDTMIAPFFGN